MIYMNNTKYTSQNGSFGGSEVMNMKINKYNATKIAREYNVEYKARKNIGRRHFWFAREVECLIKTGKSYAKAMTGALKRANNACEITGKRGNVSVHHKNGYKENIEQGADINNLVVLDAEVHAFYHQIFGVENNTAEQFDTFVNNFNAGKYGNWKKAQNIRAKNSKRMRQHMNGKPSEIRKTLGLFKNLNMKMVRNIKIEDNTGKVLIFINDDDATFKFFRNNFVRTTTWIKSIRNGYLIKMD